MPREAKCRGKDFMRPDAQLEVSAKRFNDLKAALDEHMHVAIVDSQGLITHVNDKFCAISKYSREELLGQDHHILSSGHHSKGFIGDVWAAIGCGRAWHGEIKNRAKDGSFYWINATIMPSLKEQGKTHQYIAICADVTARRAAEKNIRQLNLDLERHVRDRTAQLDTVRHELEVFSHVMSHDLRGPLQTIREFSEVILEDFETTLSDEVRRYLQTIRSSAQRMGGLVEHLLIFERLNQQELNKRTIDTETLVRDTLDELGFPWRDRQVEVHIGELPPSSGDPALLKVVWRNLLSNALKYTRKREKAEVEIGCVKTNGTDTFYARDNGTGFDMRHADKLFGVFQRFHRAEDYEGAGVGLAIVQRAIQRHGGHVWADATVDQGATFYFTLEGKNNP